MTAFAPLQEPVKRGYLQSKQYFHMQCKLKMTPFAPVQQPVKQGCSYMSSRFCVEMQTLNRPFVKPCLQERMKHRNQQLAQMIEQSAQRPAPGGSMRMSPLLRIDLREESVTEPAEPGGA